MTWLLVVCGCFAVSWLLTQRKAKGPVVLPPADAGVLPPSAYLLAAQDRWERSGRASLGKERVTR
jgi:hypothetical protein